LGVEWVLDWRVKYRDADISVGVDWIDEGILLGWNSSVLKVILGGW
jgi:hypothetical protein